MAAKGERTDRRDQAGESLPVKQATTGSVHIHSKCAVGQAGIDTPNDSRYQCDQCCCWQWQSRSEHPIDHRRFNAAWNLRARVRAVADTACVQLQTIFQCEDRFVASAQVLIALETKTGTFHDAAGNGVDGSISQAADAVVACVDQTVQRDCTLRDSSSAGQ